jgi:hypothetical protein
MKRRTKEVRDREQGVSSFSPEALLGVRPSRAILPAQGGGCLGGGWLQWFGRLELNLTKGNENHD